MVIIKFLIKFNVNSPNISLKNVKTMIFKSEKSKAFIEYSNNMQDVYIIYLRIQQIILCVNSL